VVQIFGFRLPDFSIVYSGMPNESIVVETRAIDGLTAYSIKMTDLNVIATVKLIEFIEERHNNTNDGNPINIPEGFSVFHYDENDNEFVPGEVDGGNICRIAYHNKLTKSIGVYINVENVFGDVMAALARLLNGVILYISAEN